MIEVDTHISSVGFDWESLDGIDDVLAECILTKEWKPLWEVIEKEVQKGRSEIVAGLLDIIFAHENCELSLQCLAIASGCAKTQYLTLAKVAAQHNISRAAVSKRCSSLRKQFGLHNRRQWTDSSRRKLSALKKKHYKKKLKKQLGKRGQRRNT